MAIHVPSYMLFPHAPLSAIDVVVCNERFTDLIYQRCSQNSVKLEIIQPSMSLLIKTTHSRLYLFDVHLFDAAPHYHMLVSQPDV